MPPKRPVVAPHLSPVVLGHLAPGSEADLLSGDDVEALEIARARDPGEDPSGFHSVVRGHSASLPRRAHGARRHQW